MALTWERLCVTSKGNDIPEGDLDHFLDQTDRSGVDDPGHVVLVPQPGHPYPCTPLPCPPCEAVRIRVFMGFLNIYITI